MTDVRVGEAYLCQERLRPTKSTVPAIFREAGLSDALNNGAVSGELIEWFGAAASQSEHGSQRAQEPHHRIRPMALQSAQFAGT